jgi:LPS-assembly lipoprotein
MWFPDRLRPALAALVLLAGVAGCTDIRPLYGTTGPAGAPSPVASALAAIQLQLVDTRVEQRLRNELIFAFTGGTDPGPPTYRLDVRLTQTSAPVGVVRLADTPAAFILQLTASYTLIEIGTGRTLTTGTSFANASYDFSAQRFANVRAQRDAENRAVNVIAQDMRSKVASYFATRRS